MLWPGSPIMAEDWLFFLSQTAYYKIKYALDFLFVVTDVIWPNEGNSSCSRHIVWLIVNYVNFLPRAEMLSGFMLHEIVAWESQIFSFTNLHLWCYLFHLCIRNSQHLQVILKKKKKQSHKWIIDNIVF